MYRYTLRLVATALVALFVSSQVIAGQDGISVHDAWIREAPPNARVLAGYMILDNQGQETVRLTGVEAGGFESAEMHRTVHRDGIASMEHQPYLDVPPGEQVTMAPGGYHLMLIGPGRRFVAGDRVTLELLFQDGAPIPVQFEVRRSGDAGGDHDHHHH